MEPQHPVVVLSSPSTVVPLLPSAPDVAIAVSEAPVPAPHQATASPSQPAAASALALQIATNEKTVHYHTLRQQLSLKQQRQLANSVHLTQRGPAGASQLPAQPLTDSQLQAVRSEDDASDEHLLSVEQLAQRFQLECERGLSSEQVQRAHAVQAANVLSPPPSVNIPWRLFVQLIQGFNIALWIAAMFAFLTYYVFGDSNKTVDIGLAVVLMLDIVINVVFNFYQELKSIRIVRSFQEALPSSCTVLRDGRKQLVDVSELVVGDVVLVKTGEQIPADLRMIEVAGLQVNNSALTGESEPVHSTVHSSSANYLESTNIAFLSSLVVNGNGTGIVVSTGDDTVLGRVNLLTRGSSNAEITSLHREINRFVVIIVFMACVTAGLIWLTWGVWLNRSSNPEFDGYITKSQNIVNTIGLIVAFIPEGLPPAVTLILTIVAVRMYKQKVLVKSLATLETFNSVSLIATDKTGTLTQNAMTVVHIKWGQRGDWLVPATEPQAGSTDSASSPVASVPSSAVLNFIIEAAALCNNAEFVSVERPTRDGDKAAAAGAGFTSSAQIVGDGADTALVQLIEGKCHRLLTQIRQAFPRHSALPFSSKLKLMVSINADPSVQCGSTDESCYRCTLKGAPEYVLARCDKQYDDDGSELLDLTAERRAQWESVQTAWGEQGFRVLAIAQQFLSRAELQQLEEKNGSEPSDFNGAPASGYRLLGLFAMMDPPRQEVSAALQTCREAGIRVAMVTGDHQTTAVAIARQVNIFSPALTSDQRLDSCKIGVDELGRPVLMLFRNGQQLQTHLPGASRKDDIPHSTRRDDKKLAALRDPQAQAAQAWNMREKACSWWLDLKTLFVSTSSTMERPASMPYACVVNGHDLDLFDDWMWSWVLGHQELVFARTSPEQKLKIVMEAQHRGEVVAVTGDGTNDAPALRRAELGVAMFSGTDVARDAGDIILLDNNFASVVNSIETGRLLSDNIKKVCLYLLPAGSWSELTPFLANVWLGLPLALPSFLAIVFCVTNDVCNALALVNERPERNIMQRPPINRSKDRLVNLRLLAQAYLFLGNLETFSAFFCFCWYWNDQGYPLGELFLSFNNFGSSGPNLANNDPDKLAADLAASQGVYYVALVVLQFFNLFSTRTRYESIFSHNPLFGKGQNLWLFLGMACSVLFAVGVTQIEFFNTTFLTAPVPVKYVCPAIGFGALIFTLDEIRKLLVRRYPNGALAYIAW